jgi:hypothetical protein
MYHNTTYAKSTNAPAPVPGQVLPSSTTSAGEVNVFNGIPPNVEFQVRAYPAAQYVCLPSLEGEQYDQLEPGPALTFATQALASHVVNIQVGHLSSWSVTQTAEQFFL